MKQRVIAFFLAIILVLSLLSGCGKVAIDDAAGSGADKGEVLNLLRDVSSKVTAYWADAFTSVGSSALSVGMGGVLIIDKMLTAFAEEAYSTKLEDIAYVYHFYNERYTGCGTTVMSAAQNTGWSSTRHPRR